MERRLQALCNRCHGQPTATQALAASANVDLRTHKAFITLNVAAMSV